MKLLGTYRLVVLMNLVVVFVQFVFAGQLLAGSDSIVAIHGVTGVLLLAIALVQTAVSIALRAKRLAPTWIIATNVGLIMAEMLEAVCGHFHNLAIHVPLAVAIFGGVMRQLFWSFREIAPAEIRT